MDSNRQPNIIMRLAERNDIPDILQVYSSVSAEKNAEDLFSQNPSSFEKKGAIFSIPSISDLESLLEYGLIAIATINQKIIGFVSFYTINLTADLSNLKMNPLTLHSLNFVTGIDEAPIYFEKTLENIVMEVKKGGASILWGRDIVISPEYQGKGIGYSLQIWACDILLKKYTCWFYFSEIYKIISIRKNGSPLENVSMENKPSKKLHCEILQASKIGAKQPFIREITAQNSWKIEIESNIFIYDIRKILHKS